MSMYDFKLRTFINSYFLLLGIALVVGNVVIKWPFDNECNKAIDIIQSLLFYNGI